MRLVSALLLLLLIQSATANSADPAHDLYAAVGERLSLMRDVAAFKWLHELPVEDLERETVVIDAAVASALNRQIRPETAERFFRVQIEAAKDIQRHWFERWQTGQGPQSAPDLVAEVRPELLRLGERINRLMGAAISHERSLFLRLTATEGLNDDRTEELFDSLRSVGRFEGRLEQILETGLLRVGTTGDYAPFSYLPVSAGEVTEAQFTGVDIELAEDLARSLGVTLELVQTSWPTLLDDLQAGRYDVAMGGVSRTLARARVGHLSLPYYVGGKMPIARCEDRRRFNSLAGIDQAGVRVIVNPGGTNEQFVDEHLLLATKVAHPDNRTIFAALLAGEGDVMVTDSIEVALQARRNPGLCGTMGTTLTYQEKAYLMPRDADLKSFVDTWLSLRLGDGTVNLLLQNHLSVP